MVLIGMQGTTQDVNITNNSVTYNNTSWFIAHSLSIYTLTYSPRDMFISSTTQNIYVANNNTYTPLK